MLLVINFHHIVDITDESISLLRSSKLVAFDSPHLTLMAL